METNLPNPTRSYHVTRQEEERIKIWQDVTKVRNFGTKIKDRHRIKEEVKGRFISKNAVIQFTKVYLCIFYSKTQTMRQSQHSSYCQHNVTRTYICVSTL
jgi:hypothetical protein